MISGESVLHAWCEWDAATLSDVRHPQGPPLRHRSRRRRNPGAQGPVPGHCPADLQCPPARGWRPQGSAADPEQGSTPPHHRPDEGLGRSRGGLTCKIHLAGEGGCRPYHPFDHSWPVGRCPADDRGSGPDQGSPRWADGPGLGLPASAVARHTAPAETAATSGDATSSTPLRNRRASAPTADAKAVRAEDPPTSTLTAIGAATRSSELPTASRTPVLSRPVTTNGPVSSMAPSPQQLVAYGSDRELPETRRIRV